MWQTYLNYHQGMGILPLKKRVNRNKCSFTTKQRMFGVFAIDEILRYRGTQFPGSRTLCHPGPFKSRNKTLTENFRILYFSSCGQPTVEDEELSGTCNYWLEVRLSSELLKWDSLSNWDNPWNLLQVRFSLRYAQSFSLSQITKLGGIYSIWGGKCGKN